MNLNHEKISKELSYALRHAPAEYELKLDDQGWVDIEKLLDSFHKKTQWTSLTKIDLLEVIEKSTKKRHEIKDNKIRAVYGHSTPEKIQHEQKQPPEILYHGTPNKFVDSIMKEGLKPQSRQYVHLSSNVETAKLVGERRDEKPVILIIKALEAHNNGIKFYHANENIWLAEFVPHEYISK